MPLKRKKKVETKPWNMIPNFEEERDFQLVIEQEDSFGNKKRMHMDHNMKLVPITEEKENIKANFIRENKTNSILEEKMFSPLVNVNQRKEKKILNESQPVIVQHILDKTVELKGILKKTKPIITNPSNIPDEIVFSSPIMKGTPRNKGHANANKQLLIDKLKGCKETPILALVPIDYKRNEDSLEYLLKNDSMTGSSKLSRSLSMQIKAAPETGNMDASTPLFSDIDLDSVDHKSEVVEEIGVSFYIAPNVKTPAEKESFTMVNAEDRKKWLQLAKRRSRIIKRRQGLTDSFWHIFHVEDSLSVILALCQLSSIQPFAKIFPVKSRKGVAKLGEGSFGEVFMVKNSADEDVVVKFIPVDGELEYNGAPMTKYDDVLSEIVIAKELSDLSMGSLNRCKNFVQLASVNSVSVTRGRFPSYFQTEWEKANKTKKSENDNPKLLGSQQAWIVLQFQFAGCPLEDFPIESWRQAFSVLAQVALSLACAESHAEFEHRDLHMGNVLVLQLDDDEEESTFMIDGRAISLALHGLKATIIDFTFSRIDKDNNTVYIDLSKDKDLFLGTGDIQFDVYRRMQKHNGDDWRVFYPRSNLFWLQFLAQKLAEKVDDRDRTDTDWRRQFQHLCDRIESCNSTMQLIGESFVEIDPL